MKNTIKKVANENNVVMYKDIKHNEQIAKLWDKMQEEYFCAEMGSNYDREQKEIRKKYSKIFGIKIYDYRLNLYGEMDKEYIIIGSDYNE